MEAAAAAELGTIVDVACPLVDQHLKKSPTNLSIDPPTPHQFVASGRRCT